MREEIMSGNLEPGARLREVEVAQRFGVSRTPAREALKKLKAGGLIAEVAGRGLTVSNPSLNEILDAYQIREVLEGLATQLATERALDTEIMMMETVLQLTREAHREDDVGRAITLCEQFDSLIFAAARNTQLESIIETLRTSQGSNRRGNIQQSSRRAEAISEREIILKAIQSRDSAAADQAAREHLRKARTFRIERSLAEGALR